MNIIRLLLIALLGLFQYSIVLGQCGGGNPNLDELLVINPSFEGPPGAHITPNPWNTCGITPDTQPGFWGVNQPASQGNTYVGFVNGGPAWMEGASQALSGNMVAGTTYTFTIDLSNTPANQGGLVPAPSQLVIHGANNICQRTELLWQSPFIAHNNWQTYTVTFTPTQNYSHIYFSIGPNSPANSYILLDNITPIVPDLPSIDITSNIDGDIVGCQFVLSGELSLPLADSVVLTGPFVGSPMHANVTGSTWSQTVDFTGTGNYTIYARVYYIDPQTGAEACSYDSVIMNVAGPVLDYTFDNHCFNETAMFTDASYILGTGTITDWEWDFGDGTTSTNPNTTHQYAAPGTYNVNFTVTDGNGCETVEQAQITVHPLPVASISAVSACAQDALAFNSQSTVASGTVAQTLWDVQGDGVTDYTTAAASHVFNPHGSYDITLIAITDNGCRDTVTQAVIVHPLPISDFDFVNACHNQEVTFIATSTVVSGSVDQTLWDVQNDGSTDYNTAADSHVYPADGSYTISLITVTNNGCRDTNTQNITVYPLPVSDFSFVNACHTAEVSFTSESTVSSGTVDQTLWDVQNDGTTDYTTAAGTHVYPAAGSYDVTLIAITNNNCSDTLTQAITVYPLPVADFDFVNACHNAAVTFNTQSNVISGNVTQTLWDVESDGTDDYTTANGSHIYPADGTYDITLIAITDNACRDTITQTITVYPLPVSDFSFVNACHNQEVTFNSESTVTSGTVDQTIWDVESDGADDYTTANGSHLYPADGTYDVTLVVVTDNSCRDTLTQTITVYPLPVSDFTFVNACHNEAVSFTSQSTVSSGTVDQAIWDVESDGTDDYTAVSGTHVYGADGTYDVTLVAITNFGCADTIKQMVTVYPLPVSAFSFVNACNHEAVTFTSQSTVSSGTVDQTLWDVDADGIDDYTTPNGSHVYPADGSYDITLIAITDNACRDTVTHTVAVAPLPLSTFTFTNVCNNQQFNFTSTSTVSSGTVDQTLWDVQSDGTTDYTTASASHVYATDGAYDITLIVITDNGCSDTLTQTGLIYPLPVADWSAAAVCLNNATAFVDASGVTQLDNDVITLWEWTFGDGNSSTDQNPTHTYTDENVYSTQLIVTTNFGCKDTLSNDVTVWPLPTVNFSPTDVCLDFLTDFQDLSTVSNDHSTNNNVQWVWAFGDPAGGVANVQNPSYAYTQDGTFNAQLTVTTDNGCVNSVTIPVTVHAKPTASFVGTNLQGCSPVCAQLNSTSTVNPTSSIVQWEWVISDGTTHTNATPNQTVCFANPTGGTLTYNVQLTVTTDKGCVNTVSQQNYITVYHNPIADFYAESNNLMTTSPTTQFVNQSQYADSYTWDFGYNSPLVTTTSPIHTFPADIGDTYIVTLIASTANGCLDTAQAVINVREELIFYVPTAFTPTNDDNLNQDFKPVFARLDNTYDYVMYIFNRWGERIFETHDIMVGWDGNYGNTTNMCKADMYIWKVEFKSTIPGQDQSLMGRVFLLR